jgi:hypothetical protein
MTLIISDQTRIQIFRFNIKTNYEISKMSFKWEILKMGLN